MALALRDYLDEEPAPPVALTPRESDGPLGGELVGARKLVGQLAELGLDAEAISEATGLDLERVVAALAERP